MPQNPPEGYTRVTPYIYYEDVAAAVDFAVSAFGFHERFRMDGPDGRVVHAEIDYDGSIVMMGSPGGAYENPKQHGHRNGLIYVYVDDVDSHCAHATAAGASIVRPLEDQFYGDRNYVAEDPEGHQWDFAQCVREVTPAEMKAASATA